MSGCTLQLVRDSPLRTILVDEATGHAKYHIDTPGWPMQIARCVTRIRKFDSPTHPHHHHHWDGDAESDYGGANSDSSHEVLDIEDNKKWSKLKKDKGGDETEPGLPETSDEMARIYWKWFSSDKIIFGGRMTNRLEFLPKTGKLGRSYLFTGPDGVQYRWALGAVGLHHPKLVTTDEKQTVIAEFHPGHHKQKARFEVQPAGMEMLDHIVLAFVMVETKRRERRTRAKSQYTG